MGRHYQILLPLFSLFLVRVDLTDLIPLTYEVELLKLTDADTALVGLGKRRLKVRLSRIDAPEKGQPFSSGLGDAGAAATNCAKKAIGKKRKFTLTIYKQDIYGRILGDLDRLTLELIKRGCASLYPYAEFSSRHEKMTYLRALNRARQQRQGLWALGGYMQPKKWRKSKRRKSF